MAFAPNTVAGLIDHWDPDSIAGTDGDAISTWTGGVNSVAFSGPSGSEPLLMGAAREASAHQMALMTSAGQRFRTADAAMHTAKQTVLMVYVPLETAKGTANQWLFNRKNTNPAAFAALQSNSHDGLYRAGVRLSSTPNVFDDAVATGYYHECKTQVVAVRFDGSNLIMRVNGVEVANTAVSGDIDTSSAGDWVLGNHPSSFSAAYAMFGDVAVWGVGISDADLAAQESDLMAKWNISTTYNKTWTTGSPSDVATPATGEDEIFSPQIVDDGAGTLYKFATIHESGGTWRWVDYWTSGDNGVTWTRNAGGTIIDASVDTPAECRGVAAVLDGSTWHILVDDTGGFHHFTGTDLGALTDNGHVFGGSGTGWEQYVRHPSIPSEKVSTKFAMYYDARTSSATSGFGSIGLAYTADFATFDSRQEVFVSSDKWWEHSDVGAPSVKWSATRSQWEMAYAGFSSDARGTEANHFIGLAKSADGIAWTRLTEEVPILVPEAEFSSKSVDNPELFDDGTDLWLYYVSRDAAVDADVAKIQVGSDSIAFLDGGTTVTLGRATEVDTARALTIVNPRTYTLGKATETDTARAITVANPRTYQLGRATETDAARALTVVQSQIVTLGRATETDSARALTVINPRTYQLGRATEADTARPLTVVQSTLIALGRAIESDLARGLTVVNPRTYSLGRATESSTARQLAIVNPRTYALGRATEVDVARALTISAGSTAGNIVLLQLSSGDIFIGQV